MKSMYGETLKIESSEIFISPVWKDEDNAIVHITPRPIKEAELLKQQIVQMSWRPHALIVSLEKQAKELKNHTQPQNFKLYDMLLAEAEILRVLLRQCQIPEPPKPDDKTVKQ